MSDSSRETTHGRPAAPRYQPLVIVLAAACLGIVIDHRCPLPLGAWWVIGGGAWVAWLVLWRRGPRNSAAAVLLLAVVAVAAGWHHCRWYLFAEDDLGRHARAEPRAVCIEAIALKGARRVPAPPYDPMRVVPAGDCTQVEIEAVSLRDQVQWRPASGRATLTVNGTLPDVNAGDRLRIFAQLVAPSPPENPGGFDFAAHYRADRKRCLLRAHLPECVTVVQRAAGWTPGRLIDSLRIQGNELLWQHLDHRRSPLAAAVLLGAREQLSYQQTEAFFETGTVHLLAISGLHVGMVAGMLFLLMRLALVPRRRAALVVAAVTVLYTLLTDARPPAVRAMILVLVLCLSIHCGRRALAFNSLAAAALVVLALNPADLFRVGAQLSFLAVAGLMWFAPRWVGAVNNPDPLRYAILEARGWASRTALTAWRVVLQLTLVSATIWLLTLPLVMARFHLVAPIAVLLNAVLWPLMAIALASGFGILVFGWLIPPLAAICGWFCDRTLFVLDWHVAHAQEWDWARFWAPGPDGWWLAGFYGGMAVMAASTRLRPPRRWCLALLAGWSAAGLAVGILQDNPRHPRCTFLSVGHGCAIVLELPSGQTVLYDAGSLASPHGCAQSVAGYLWSRGIVRLEAVIISHADADHYNALPELLDRFSVGVVYVSPTMFPGEDFEPANPALTALASAIRDKGVEIRQLHSGKRLEDSEGCRIDVLHPPPDWVAQSDNGSSLVVSVQWDGYRILLTGDIESETSKSQPGVAGLGNLLPKQRLDCDLLLAPHHGSTRSMLPDLAAYCTPELVVVSGGHDVDLGKLEDVYKPVNARVLHTALSGAVWVTITEGQVEISHFLCPTGNNLRRFGKP